MPSFNETFQAHSGGRLGPPCFTGSWRNELTPDDREQFDQALGNPRNTSAAIFRTMKAMGYEYGDSSVARHRRGECTCSRTN